MSFYGCRYKKLIAALVCFFSIFLTTFSFWAFADDTQENTYLIQTPEDEKNAEANMMVGTLQQRLTDLGYYNEKITLIFDAVTRFALYNFCQANGLAFDDAGVSQSVWDTLMSGDAVPAGKLPAYTFIEYGTVSDEVLELQNRLRELGYYEGLITEPKVYDEDLQTAIDRFCEINAVAYDRSGITPEVQELIYSRGAASYTPPEQPTVSRSEKFVNYMMKNADLLFIVVPVFVVWIFIIFLLLTATFIVIHLVLKRKAARKEREREKQLSGKAAGFGQSRKNIPPPLQEKQKTIHFQIDYNGQTRNVEKDASSPIVIGRGDVDIRLNSSDQGVELRHCVLLFKGAVLMLQDKSDKGTYVNDSLFHKCTTPVRSGDRIVIGSHNIFLRF